MRYILVLLLCLSPLMAAADEAANQAYLRATYFLSAGEPEKAIEELDRAISLDPESGHLRTIYGRTLIAMGNIDQGRRALEKATKLSPQNSEAFKILGLMSFRQLAQGDADEAQVNKTKDLLQRAAALDPTDLESRYYLAFIFEEEGKLDRSYAMLKQAVEIDNSRPELLQKAAETAERLDYPRDAASYYERASLYLEKLATRLKDNLKIQFELGKLSLWDTQKYDVAVIAYDRIIEATTGDMSMTSYRIEAEIGKATALYFMEDYQPAKELFGKNEQFVYTRYPRSIAPMLLAYSNLGDTDHALELSDLILEQMDGNPLFRNFILRLKGLILSDAEEYEAAAEVFEQSIREFPEESITYQQYAQVWLDAEDYTEAEAVVQRAYDAFGEENADVLFTEAVVEEEQGNIDQAMALLERVIQLDPDDDLALNFLGYMYAENKQNLEKAEKYLLDALELSPNQGSYLDSLGWVYYQLGNMDLAEKYLKKAYRTKYMTAEVREHLGYLYLALGKKDEALEEFEAAIEYDLAEVKETDEVEEMIRTLKRSLEPTS